METVVSRKYLAGKAFPRDTHKTFCFARLCYLIHTFCTHTIYTHFTDKCKGVLLRENLAKHLESQRLLYPQFSTQQLVDFPELLPLHFHTIKRLITQTLITPFQSVKWPFGVVGKHWKKPRMADATWSLLQDPESQTRHSSEKTCWSRSLEGLDTAGRLGLQSLLLTHVSQLIV